MFIFGFLLVGNIVALLFSSAMVKMFMLEFVLKTYCWLSSDGPGRYISGVTYRFYVFVFGLIAEQRGAGIPRPITLASSAIHLITVVVLPMTFILVYCTVLMDALVRFWTEKPTGATLLGANVELWYFAILVFFNILTLSFYAFAFFPCPVPAIPAERLRELVAERFNELWELAGRPEGRDQEIRDIAGRQIKLRYHVHDTVVDAPTAAPSRPIALG